MTRAAACALLLLVAACAQLEQQFAERPQFELTGRLAARYGEESFTGNIAWRHGPGADEMLITSPLGQGVARIVRSGGEVTLSTAEPREYRAADAESLTEQVLGFRLPLAGLADWVQARASPATPAKTQFSPDGKLLLLEQAGWTIEYQQYADALPTRMRVIYPGIELRLVISQWK